MQKKLIVLVGPTASGKSGLAVELARALRGEVVSADSRQVYRGMNLGSGKITKCEMRGVPHWLLDVADPRRTFSVVRYRNLARRAIHDIWRRGKLPILCGGTGFYVQAVVDGLAIPNVRPNAELRKTLAALPNDELHHTLSQLDPERAKTIDRSNPRRLVRAIEIARALGTVPRLEKSPIGADVLWIGLEKSSTDLRRCIHARLLRRLRGGMVAEVKCLHDAGLSWQRLENFGLEYKTIARHLQGKIAREQAIAELERDIVAYVRRQMTWWRREHRIRWVRENAAALALARRFVTTSGSPAL